MGRDGTMTDYTINSEYLNEAMVLKVYTPNHFSPLYKYHFCIMQDGNDYFQMGRAATLSDRLHADQEIENTIFVGIHYNDKYDRQDKYHPDGSKQGDYVNFLIREVVPFLDEHLPGYHVGSGRTLVGDSLAGTLALMTAVKFPNLFGNVIMQSPYVDEHVLEIVDSAKDLSSLTIYHTIGIEETDVETTAGESKNFLEPNRHLKEVLDQKPVSYTYYELDGGHTWKPWQQDFKRALLTMFGK
ncbi:alpha/beta hydrolase-fold protein [Halobacillus salinarum]|uniref:Alpha/beta hydrolase-fold protein n=1 Tax=Halobacillus salinarum TaxID=2932257 RepID=A0ABY4EFZ9_9BACI|nr:alpha/beta hydrolase-fold protein [Halobacillus salinarum]UOQ43404.1 alpha/beta hydrolase-fold protein [Halobacillus salinarum]